MKTIVVSSKNPVKIRATLNGFRRMFPDETFTAETVTVPSGVSDQPMSDEEALRGAMNRADAARQVAPETDYWVGIEGGAEEMAGEIVAFAWVVVMDGELLGKSRTAAFFLPNEIAELMRQGKELGDADDIVFGRTNSKQDNGAVGILTGDVIDRTAFYEHAVVLALIPFRNRGLYSQPGTGGGRES